MQRLISGLLGVLSWIKSISILLVTRIIRMTGPIPRHLAIIMDGNRRFSKMKNMSYKEGYEKG
jgi:ditrans,polycis-polyprenyl diphosphate synthase